MAQVTRSRRAAARILTAVSRGRRLDLAFHSAATSLAPQDRRFVQELTYGTLRYRGRLDHLLDLHLHRGIGSVSPQVLDLLRLGSYQLFHMDSVPGYAAVSQTVDQIREVAGKGGARLANGVLRSLLREGAGRERFPDLGSDPEGHLSTWGSHPRWLIQRWLRRWPVEEVVELVAANNRPAPLFFRPLGPGLAEAAQTLSEAGLGVEEAGPGVPCLRLADGIDPARIMEMVPGIIQDPGAALVPVYADLPGHGPVGDLCAAPGGKALALAEGGIYVLAADRSLRRLGLVRENAARLGYRIDLVAALAQAPPFRELPAVLLDVPCSGTGTFRRHPDARWRLTDDTLRTLVRIQREILDAGAATLARGGVLVYSTCTLEEEENREQVESFLARTQGFAMAPSGTVPPRFMDEEGFLSVTPQSAGFDGAFAARLVRRK